MNRVESQNPCRASTFARARSWSLVGAVRGAVLSLNLFSITTANADPYWTNAIETARTRHAESIRGGTGSHRLHVVGQLRERRRVHRRLQAEQAFLSQETNGVWSSATEVGAALNVGGVGGIIAISCPSAGNCTAEGYYTDNSARSTRSSSIR